MGNYASIVKEIRDLKWGSLSPGDLQKLMVLSAYSALEFAESLRLALKTHPKNSALKRMAKEELSTDTLSFGGYARQGDHADFLWHFIRTYGLLGKHKALQNRGKAYLQQVRLLSPEVRVMSIVSREKELPGIFARILTAKNWKAKGLPEYRYYLERHIVLDSAVGGHADMLSNMPIDDRVADFYRARLNMYRCLPKLFMRRKFR